MSALACAAIVPFAGVTIGAQATIAAVALIWHRVHRSRAVRAPDVDTVPADWPERRAGRLAGRGVPAD